MEVEATSAPEAYRELLDKILICGVKEDSRNGPVIRIPEPVMLTIYDPRRRVITDPIRDANPYFHMAEFVWVMSGSDEIDFLAQFNKKVYDYSDDSSTWRAAYGQRLRRHFGYDQIQTAYQMLKKDPNTRRCVLNIWDASFDLDATTKDVPCNTQIMLSITNGRLHFTVINRSNDLIWGMLGSNVVVFTMLQELLAEALGVNLGTYRVFTNNLHLYPEVESVKRQLQFGPIHEVYSRSGRYPPILAPKEHINDFLADCEYAVEYGSGSGPFRTEWMNNVFRPTMLSKKSWEYLSVIDADDWRIACAEWRNRRK